jgi:hypothetical protein
VILLSGKSLFIKGFSVLIDVISKLFKGLLKSVSLWVKDVVNKVIGIEDVLNIIDILLVYLFRLIQFLR